MDVVTESFHSMRKSLRVDDDISFFVAAHLPAVVDIDVDISRIFHAGLDHRVSHSPDHLFADVAPEFVPAVPPHRGSEGKICRSSSDLSGGSENTQDYQDYDSQEVCGFHAQRFTRTV